MPAGGRKGGPNAADCEAQLAARLSGKPTYTATTPCKHGHIGARYTGGSGCVQCAVDREKRRRAHLQSIRERHNGGGQG